MASCLSNPVWFASITASANQRLDSGENNPSQQGADIEFSLAAISSIVISTYCEPERCIAAAALLLLFFSLKPGTLQHAVSLLSRISTNASMTERRDLIAQLMSPTKLWSPSPLPNSLIVKARRKSSTQKRNGLSREPVCVILLAQGDADGSS
jgi:hypothetical protein